MPRTASHRATRPFPELAAAMFLSLFILDGIGRLPAQAASESPPPASQLSQADAAGEAERNEPLWDYQPELLFGYEAARTFPDDGQELSAPFLRGGVSGRAGVLPFNFKLTLLGRQNTAAKGHIPGSSGAGEHELGEWRPEEAWLNYEKDQHKVQVGLQKVTWGETFGFPIADVVNPIDWSRSPLTKPEDSKLASWLGHYQYFDGVWSLQGLASPWSSHRQAEAAYHDALGGGSAETEPILEYGGRAGLLTAAGLDIKASAYHHQNRTPLYRLESGPSGPPTLNQVSREMDTYGISFSYDFDGTLIRADSVHEPVFYLNGSDGTLAETGRTGAIIGADRTVGEDWFVGMQVYGENLSPSRSGMDGSKHVAYLGAQLIYPFLMESYQAKVFFFEGINVREGWLRSELSLAGPSGLRFEAVYDLLYGEDIGLLSRLDTKSRFYAQVSWLAY